MLVYDYTSYGISINFDSSGKVFLLSFLPFLLYSTSFQVSIPYQIHQTTFQSNFPFHSISKLDGIFSLKMIFIASYVCISNGT